MRRAKLRRPFANNYCTGAIEVHCPKLESGDKQSTADHTFYNFFSASFLTKASAFITILSGIFGLCYQKGMISAMQFGNMQGSYDVKEILYSSLQAYYSFFENISKISAYKVFDRDLYFFVSISGISSIIFYSLYVNRENIRSYLQSWKIRFDNHHRTNSLPNYLLVGFIGLVVGIAIKFVHAIGMFLFIAIIALLLLPSALAYKLGAIDAEKAMKSEPCYELTDNGLAKLDKNAYVRQCTHLVINKKLLKGRIMLGTQNGYYLRINGAFVYVSHDGKSCVYSQDKIVSDIKSADSIFPSIEQLQDFCYAGKAKSI